MAEPSAPEDFASLLPKRLITPGKQPGLDAMSEFMARTRTIADDAKMPPHLKDAHLTALEGALTTQEGYVPLPKGVSPTIMSPGFTLRRESDERKIPVIYGRRVVQAYKQDATKKGYRDWSDLLAYVRYSAGAAAQYTLEVLGLDRALAPGIEALAIAHALLARMESLGDDIARKRLYLPQRWLQDAGLDLDELSLDDTAKWLKVRDEGVAQARKLLVQAAPVIKSARFAAETPRNIDTPGAASEPATKRGSNADGILAGPGTIEGRAHSGADVSGGAGAKAGGVIDRWKLKLALAWVKAGLDARCDALAVSATFPAAPSAPPSMARLALASLRSLM